MDDMTTTEPLVVAERWHREGKPVAIATVIETWSSAPCAAGSHLVIDADGNFHGSLSGGCVENAVIAEARSVLDSGRTRMLDFGVTDATARHAGLACGGRIRIFVERLD